MNTAQFLFLVIAALGVGLWVYLHARAESKRRARFAARSPLPLDAWIELHYPGLTDAEQIAVRRILEALSDCLGFDASMLLPSDRLEMLFFKEFYLLDDTWNCVEEALASSLGSAASVDPYSATVGDLIEDLLSQYGNNERTGAGG